ncbi:biotin-dependent carboxyltransferase family protein [Paenibacillus sp. JCM 10914]|uniref:5-oxoprolinase subunit C family protein n=1 Tax=Paenibacillus sp. JCM 10914 TaxID=1236974 RepID=UPI0003CC4F9A|nr:biotin-dependent carboxyltransferase family protein [Paenibacillus sp. JCM 10914]GAE05124.1 allophanate hydrolase 2 subunit 2 [Paenibacillus sp. JCM 10914]
MLEITWSGLALEIQTTMWLSITGGDLSPRVNGSKLPMWRPVRVKAGSVLSFQMPITGCRAYLAISGGFQVDPVMDSYSTYIRAGIGGYEGRPLQKGDVLHTRPSNLPLNPNEDSRLDDGDYYAVPWSVSAEDYALHKEQRRVRVLRGRQFEDFDNQSQQHWLGQAYQVTPQSDRMGYRLSGSPLQLISAKEYISEPVSLGTVQVPADGQPIILMADRQTLGGYPKIAQVISVDIPRIAQIPPGGRLLFEEVTLSEAESLYCRRSREMRVMEYMIRLKLKEETGWLSSI